MKVLTIMDLIEKQSISTADVSAPPIRQLIAITAAWFLAQMCYYAQYQMLGPLMNRFDLDEALIGVMFSQEIMVYALAMLLIAGPLSRFSRVKVAMIGGVLLIIANLVSASTESFELLRVMRLLSGMSAALIGAAGTASAASSLNPQRVFAIVTVTWGLMAALQPVLVPYLTVFYGSAGGYYGMAGIIVLFLPLCRWLIPPNQAECGTAANGSVEATQRLTLLQNLAEYLGVRNAPNARYALFMMLGLFIYGVGQGSIQVFLEQIGLRSGLDEFMIGQVIGVAMIGGLLGAVLAGWMGSRFGNIRPLIAAIILNIVFASALALAESPVVYAILEFLWTFSYYFLIPYVMGVLSEMDEQGRWAVAVDAVWWLGTAPGAAVGTMAVSAGGYLILSFIPVIGGLVSVVLLLVTLKKFYTIRESSL